MTKEALVDSAADPPKRKGKGANKYTAYTYITETEKRCSLCEKIKPHKEFHKDKRNIHGKGLAYYCKECANEKGRYFHKDKKGTPTYERSKRNTSLKRKYGLTLDQYEDKLKTQGSICAICKTPLLSFGTLTHLDHCHTTNKLRSFLCTNCNQGLGHFKDNKDFLMSAINYLEVHTANGKQKEGRCL